MPFDKSGLISNCFELAGIIVVIFLKNPLSYGINQKALIKRNRNF